MSLSSGKNIGSSSASTQGPRLVFLLCAFALLLLGVVMVYSTGSIKAIGEGESAFTYLLDQLAFAAVGVAIAFVMWRIMPYGFWRSQAFLWTAWVVALALLLATWQFGTEAYGARRWLPIAGFNVQASEFAKVAFILMTANIMANLREGFISVHAAVVAVFVLIFLPVLLIYETQSDLGTALICAAGIYAVMWLGDVDWRIMLGIGVVAVVVVFAASQVGYRSDRWLYLDPWNDGEDGFGKGYNIIRSYYALAEGGLFGVGLGNSHEKYEYLFASESDFIFAVICEELGMVGALAVIALYLALLWSGLRIAAEAPDGFGRLLAGGCTVIIVFQAFLNIGCVIGVLPTTGKPLPLVSAGSSSLIATLMMVGLILAVSRASEGPSVYDQRRADLRIVRAEQDGPYISRR